MINRPHIPDLEFFAEMAEWLKTMQPLPDLSIFIFTPDDVAWLRELRITVEDKEF